MTAPVSSDLAWLDDLERAQVLAELVAVMHKGWDGSPAVRNWIDEDWERNAEFYLPVVERARARLLAELRKRDAALRAVLDKCDRMEREAREDHTGDPNDAATVRANALHFAAHNLRADLTAALSPESVPS